MSFEDIHIYRQIPVINDYLALPPNREQDKDLFHCNADCFVNADAVLLESQVQAFSQGRKIGVRSKQRWLRLQGIHPHDWYGSDPVEVLRVGAIQGLGPELVANGTFNNAVGWDLQGGWYVGGGALRLDNGTPEAIAKYETPVFTPSLVYQVSFEIISLSIAGDDDGISVRCDAGTHGTAKTVGTHTFLVVGGSGHIRFTSVHKVAGVAVDNLSVKQALLA